VLLTLWLLLFVLIFFTAWQAFVVGSALTKTKSELRTVAQELDDGTTEKAKEAAERAQEAAARADYHSHTPVWGALKHLPVLGDDVEAVRAVSSAAHDLTDGVVVPMLDAGLAPDQLRPRNGRVAIKPLYDAHEFLVEAAPRVAEVDRSVSGLDTSGLLGPVKEPVEQLQSDLSDAARYSRAAEIATRVLPSMLGEKQDRTYLVAFQNNAEVRASGGFPGTLGVLTARNGRLDLDRTLKPRDLEEAAAAEGTGLERTAQERRLFPRRMIAGARPTFNPDFPRAAEIFRAYWTAGGQGKLDGVLSVDPVALSYLLDFSGPVKVEDGTVLRSSNAVEVLLRDTYEEPDTEVQDAFFDQAAHSVFRTVIKANGPAGALAEALSRSIDERRLAVWSAHEDERRLLAGEDVTAELPQDTGRPEIGVYFNGIKGDKLGYYMHSDVKVTPKACSAQGAQRLAIELELSSSAPETDLPRYVYGSRVPGLPRKAMRKRVYLYAPAGGSIDDVKLPAQGRKVTRAEHGVRPVAYTHIDLAPGDTKTLRYTVTTGADQKGDIRVLSTPLADGTGGEAHIDSACT
jgi:hypothetical protein